MKKARFLFGLFIFLGLLGLIGQQQQFVTVEAQAAGIYRPTSGETISGVVIVEGTATDANFLRFEVAFLNEANPGVGWIVFADGDQPVINGTLAVWDTTVGRNINAPIFPDGTYQLRLRVVRQDFNYNEYFITGVVIANAPNAPAATEVVPTNTPVPVEPTVPPTPIPPTVVPTVDNNTPIPGASPTPIPASPTPIPPTATPLPTRVVPTLVATIEAEQPPEVPEQLPSLTPFPTPEPQPTAEGEGFRPIFQDPDIGDVNTVVDGVLGFDYSVIGDGFGLGLRIAFLIFLLLGIYLLLRGSIRWVWRTISSNW